MTNSEILATLEIDAIPQNQGELLQLAKRQYHRLALLKHPDRGGSEGAFKTLANAYLLLKTPRVLNQVLAPPPRSQGELFAVFVDYLDSCYRKQQTYHRDELINHGVSSAEQQVLRDWIRMAETLDYIREYIRGYVWVPAGLTLPRFLIAHALRSGDTTKAAKLYKISKS